MTLCNCVLYLGIVFICTSAHACSLLVSVFLVHVLGLNGKSLSRVTNFVHGCCEYSKPIIKIPQSA